MIKLVGGRANLCESKKLNASEVSHELPQFVSSVKCVSHSVQPKVRVPLERVLDQPKSQSSIEARPR